VGVRVSARAPNDLITLVGTFDGSVTLGTGTPAETTLTCDGDYNGVLARYDDAGNLVWARKLGSSGEMGPESVLTLPDGSCMVTGWFSGSAVFGPGEANETTIVPQGWWDGFLAKFGADGSFLWARHIGPDGQGVRLALLTDGTVGLTLQSWNPSLALNLGLADEVKFDGLATYESAVAKYTTDGAIVWAQRTYSTGYTTNWGTGALPGGGMVIAAQYQGSTTFGQDTGANDVVLASVNGSVDTAVVAYGASGEVLWARSAGGPESDYGDEVATAADGTVYVTGTYQESITAGSETAAPESLLSPGNYEATFLLSYDVGGKFRWLRGSVGGLTSNRSRDITVFPDGAVGLAGGFSGDLTLGTGDPTQTTLTATGWDTFVARYTPAGVLDWVVQVSDEGNGEGYDLAALADNSVLVVGSYAGLSTWGAGDPNETTLSSATPRALYVARHNPDGGF
jgi:hypothetical protein